MIEKCSEVSLLSLCPPSHSERIKIKMLPRLRGCEIVAAAVEPGICVGKKKKISGRICSDFFIIIFQLLRILFNMDKRKHSSMKCWRGFNVIGSWETL